MAQRYSPYQFAVFRILSGIYLAVLFAELVPSADELFGGEAYALIRSETEPLPNLLRELGRPAEFLMAMVVLSILFAAGVFRRLASLMLWYGLYCLFHQNVRIENVSLAYIGWLLLACVLVPAGEPLCAGQRYASRWSMPPLLLFSAWVILAVSYAVAGATKLRAALWTGGTLVGYLAESAMARNGWLTRMLAELPAEILRYLTWSVIAIELSFLPLCLFRRTRCLAWLLATVMQVGIILVLDIVQLSLAILLFHLFVVDMRWIRRHRQSVRTGSEKSVTVRKSQHEKESVTSGVASSAKPATGANPAIGV